MSYGPAQSYCGKGLYEVVNTESLGSLGATSVTANQDF